MYILEYDAKQYSINQLWLQVASRMSDMTLGTLFFPSKRLQGEIDIITGYIWNISLERRAGIKIGVFKLIH